MAKPARAKKVSKPTNKFSALNSNKYTKLLLFVVLFAVVGAIFLAWSKAATASGVVKNLASGKCLENTSGLQANGNSVVMRTCATGRAAQQWAFAADGTIRTKAGYCLEVKNAARTNQSRVWLYKCSAGPGQKWAVQNNGTIKNPNSGRCLAPVNNSTNEGARLWIANCRDRLSQKWSTPKVVNPAPAPTPPPTPTPPPADAKVKPLKPGTRWQWQLTGTVNETLLDKVSGPKMYDIDMFNASAKLIADLHKKGIYVVCYVESGDWAKGRPDAGHYAPAILGKAIDGFPDEKFVNVVALDGPTGPTGKTFRQIMAARLDLARSKGCDGIEPDLDDLHTYNTGFKISQQQMVAYNKAIIDMGHALGMSVGLKNGASGGSFEKDMLKAGADWALNEECNQYDECDGYKAFVEAGKAVFQVEYLDNQRKSYKGAAGTCAKNLAAGFDGIVKDSSSKLSATPLIDCRDVALP